MDVHEIWQENKRWIVGVLIGVVVFFIAHTIVGSMFDSRRVERAARKSANDVATEPKLDQAALTTLRDEAQALAATSTALVAAVEFTPRPEFDLKGKGSFHLHFDQVSREVRARVLAGAERAGVDLTAKDMQWPTPTTQEETQSVLYALDLMDDAMARAFAASQKVREEHPEALGLVSVDELRIEGEKKGARARKRAADASDRIKEYKVSFKLRADAQTVVRLLEGCKAGGRPISLAATPPLAIRLDSKRPTDPLIVSGALLAMQVEAGKEDA